MTTHLFYQKFSLAIFQNSYMARLISTLTIATLVSLPLTAQATSLGDLFSGSSSTFDKQKPLPVNQAFQVVPTQQGNQLSVQINVTNGYYAYKDKLNLELPDGVTASPFSFNLAPTYVNDPDFGRVPVFEQTVTATTTLSSSTTIDNQPAFLKWQGCAKAGLCYPPEKVNFTITHLAANTAKSNSALQANNPINTQATASTTNFSHNATSATSSTANLIQMNEVSLVQSQDLGAQDTFGLKQHMPLALVLLFLAGLGLAFTPCVLPMLPIIANIVARQHNPSAKKGLLLTGSYGLGVATSYGILGVIIAIFGQSLGLMNILQNPVVLLGFAGLFVLLGLYMMDWLPIRLPIAVSQRLQSLGQIGENRLGSVSGSFITGFFSALVVSPCVSAPLAGAVAGVAAVGNPLIGFAALFLLGLGLSTPLILLGATQGNFMPTAGEWMNWVKKGFALMLFAVALLMIERVLLSSMMLVLWAIWFAIVAVWAWQWLGKGRLLTRAIALVLGGWMLCLLAGAATGSTDSWQPLAAFAQSRQLTVNSNQTVTADKNQRSALTIHRLAQLQPILQKYPNVLVDVTADWCIECRIMDKSLFINPPATLTNWQVVRLDVTENTADSKQVYQALQVFGPPVLLYYQDAKLVARQNGETKRPTFESTLSQLTR